MPSSKYTGVLAGCKVDFQRERERERASEIQTKFSKLFKIYKTSKDESFEF